MNDTSPYRRNGKQWDGNVDGLEFLGQGGTAFVFGIDARRVAKIPAGFDMSIRAVKRERAVFEILDKGRPSCQYVVRCLELWRPDCLVLERCDQTVREYVQSYNRTVQARVARGGEHDMPRWNKQHLMEESIKWACQAAQGLSFIHNQGIVHADVGCHNLLLDDHRNVKISDFSGSVILNGPAECATALVKYDVRSQKPGILEATKETDIFALGSVVYELATGHLPYSELPDSQVALRFDVEKWPKDLWKIASAHPAIGDTIQGCWEGWFEDADDVAWKINPDMMRRSPSPIIETDDRDLSPGSILYTGTTNCSNGTDFSVESWWQETEKIHVPSEKRGHPRKRRRRRRAEQQKKKPKVSFFVKFLTCSLY